MNRDFWVYIVASRTRVLYVGVMSNLVKRIAEHRLGIVPGFTAMSNVRRLVYCERTPDAAAALRREKQLKGWRRSKKVALIEMANPGWRDLWADIEVPRLRSG